MRMLAFKELKMLKQTSIPYPENLCLMFVVIEPDDAISLYVKYYTPSIESYFLLNEIAYKKVYNRMHELPHEAYDSWKAEIEKEILDEINFTQSIELLK
jgi:hypothetical protein